MLPKKRHKALDSRLAQKQVHIDEKSLQVWAATYFKTVLIPGEAKYEGHESGIRLGYMKINLAKDSQATRTFKQGYNRFFERFVLPAQNWFQAKGVSKGSSDGFLFMSGMTVCLEYKVDNNQPTAEQVQFAADMLMLGNPTEFPRSQEDIIAIPRKYGIRTRDITI